MQLKADKYLFTEADSVVFSYSMEMPRRNIRKKIYQLLYLIIFLEKNGFMMEGILRSNAVRDGKAIDMVMY